MPTQHHGIALITGGTSGIGRASARAFARRGYDLLLTYRKDSSKAEACQTMLEGEHGVKVVTVAGDLTEQAAVEAVFAAKDNHFAGRPVELFLHCAGLYIEGTMGEKLAGNVNFDSYDYYQEIYPKVFVRFVERILPDMEDGKGRLVALSSPGCNTGVRPRPGYDLPGQAKASLEVISRYYAVHLAPRRITCNIVLPGITATNGWDGVNVTRDMLDAFAEQRSPMKAVLEPEDIAHAVDFLMSDRGRFITGMNLNVDAGAHLS